MKEGYMLEEIVICFGLFCRELIELLEIFDMEGYDMDSFLDVEFVVMFEQEQEVVWSVYEELGDSFLKFVLYRVYGGDKLVSGNLE